MDKAVPVHTRAVSSCLDPGQVRCGQVKVVRRYADLGTLRWVMNGRAEHYGDPLACRGQVQGQGREKLDSDVKDVTGEGGGGGEVGGLQFLAELQHSEVCGCFASTGLRDTADAFNPREKCDFVWLFLSVAVRVEVTFVRETGPRVWRLWLHYHVQNGTWGGGGGQEDVCQYLYCQVQTDLERTRQ